MPDTFAAVTPSGEAVDTGSTDLTRRSPASSELGLRESARVRPKLIRNEARLDVFI